jgi:hypothetical protein
VARTVPIINISDIACPSCANAIMQLGLVPFGYPDCKNETNRPVHDRMIGVLNAIANGSQKRRKK